MSCCICSLPARGALCGHCAADPDATARHICDVLALLRTDAHPALG